MSSTPQVHTDSKRSDGSDVSVPDPFFHPANQEFLARAVKDYDDGALHYHVHEPVPN